MKNFTNRKHLTFVFVGVIFATMTLLMLICLIPEFVIVVLKYPGMLYLYSDEAKLLKTYMVCGLSGGFGPKMQVGDKQVPEGIYQATYFNAKSQSVRSIGVSYPNTADRFRNATGGGIAIHGKCASVGCIALSNPDIVDLFETVKGAKIQIIILPAVGKKLEELLSYGGNLSTFWKNLDGVYRKFLMQKRLNYRIHEGEYLTD